MNSLVGGHKILYIIAPVAVVLFLGVLWGSSSRKHKRAIVSSDAGLNQASIITRSPPSSPIKGVDLSSSFISFLPIEIVNTIFGFITEGQDLESISQVCRRSRMLTTNDNALWKNAITRIWPTQYNQYYRSNSPSPFSSWHALYNHLAIQERTRLAFTPLFYVLSIMENCAEWTSPDLWQTKKKENPSGWWVSRFMKEMTVMERVQLTLDDQVTKDSLPTETSGSIHCCVTGERIGIFRFISCDDAVKKFPRQPFLDALNLCPYVGNTVGYINFTLFSIVEENSEQASDDVRHSVVEFLKSITCQTRGVLARPDTAYHVPTVRYVDYSLESITSRYGMSDGDALLETERESAYVQEIISNAQAALDRADLGEHAKTKNGPGLKITYVASSHNPLRLTGDTSAGATSRLAGLRMKVWVYWCKLLKDERMWNGFQFGKERS